MEHRIELSGEARLRVYYEVTEGPAPCVTIRAVGVKLRERVLVGGVEIDLS